MAVIDVGASVPYFVADWDELNALTTADIGEASEGRAVVRLDIGQEYKHVSSGYITTTAGLGFDVVGDVVSFSDVGAEGTENARTPATARGDSSSTMLSLLSDSTVREINIPKGAWRFDSPINFQDVDRDITIRGARMNETLIEAYHTDGYILGLAAQDSAEHRHKYSVVAEDFSICRVGADSYTGETRPQNLRMERLRDPVMRRIDSYNGIGFALLMTRCHRPLIEHCLAHDSAIDETGTDGIHFSRNLSPTAKFNKAWNLGDDPLSFGSYQVDAGSETEIVTTDVLAVGNTSWGGAIGEEIARSTASGIKLYGNVSGARIIGQTNYSCGAGGFYFADHNSPTDCVIEDVQVIGGQNFHCQGSGSEHAGAIRWRFNDKDEVSATSIARRISFQNVEAYNCRTLFYANEAPSSYGDHYLEDWSFDGCSHIDPENPNGGTSAEFGMTFRDMRGRLSLTGLTFKNSLLGAIRVQSGGDYEQLGRLVMHNITVDGFNTAGATGSGHGIWVQESNLPVDIRNVDVRGQTVANGTSASRRVLLTNVRPDSVVHNVTGIGPNGDGITGSYDSLGTPRTATAVPTTGTWTVGTVVDSTASSGPAGWTCRLSGTFGTLGSVSATGTVGDYTLTVDSVDTLQVGEWVSAATGFSGGRNQIVKIDGLTLHLHNPIAATMSAEALSYAAPLFKTHANYV